MHGSVLGFFFLVGVVLVGSGVLNFLGIRLMVNSSCSNETKANGWLSKEDVDKYQQYLDSTFGPAKYYLHYVHLYLKSKVLRCLKR